MHAPFRPWVLLLAALVIAGPAVAGGPEPADRAFVVDSALPAVLTLTVTDHGPTCGQDTDSTATWVLSATSVNGTPHVLCARTDRASQVRFPDCNGVNQNDRRCSTNGLLQGLTESNAIDSGRFLEFKLFPTEIAQALAGTAESVTFLAPVCTVHDHGFRPCGSDADCDFGTCDGTSCASGFPPLSCTTDPECNLGPCLADQGVTETNNQTAAASPNVGLRQVFTGTLGFTPGVTDQGTCTLKTCTGDASLSCQTDPDCTATCSFGACDVNSSTSHACATDADCNLGPCIATCSNDPTARCNTNTDCNLVVNFPGASVLQDAACAGIQCGDGIVDPGEACDDGPLNGTAQSTCGCDCQPATPTTTSTSSSSSSTSSSITTTTNTSTSTSTTSSTTPPPRAVKLAVRADLVALRATTSRSKIRHELDEAIDEIDDSLDPSLWVDDSHLARHDGKHVFEEEEEAVEELQDLLDDVKGTPLTIALQGFVDRLVGADRALAAIAIEEAAGSRSDELDEAKDDLRRGDREAAKDDAEDAIEHYRQAWKEAQKALAAAADDDDDDD